MASLTTVRIALQAQVSSYVAGLNNAGQATKRFSNDLLNYAAKHEEAFNKAGQAATAVGAAAAVGVGSALRAAASFDKEMSAVSAATRATAKEMDALRQAALDAGAKTSFSAEESAQAITELGKAGVSTTAILSGGLSGALSLAAAGQLDVGDAATIAATAMTQFKLSGDAVPHVADLLAAGAGKAQGSVADLGAALQQSGLVAAQTGLTIEETSGALASFAAAGLTGSDAGTSLKTMLQALTPSSKEAATLMSQLGLSAYDSQGKFVGLTQFAGNLQGALKGMSDEQVNATLKTIFGSDAVRAASVLYAQGAKGIATWEGKVNDAGYASQTAGILLGNLSGDLENLSGAFQTALIGTGETGQGPARAAVQQATDLVNVYNNLPAQAKGAALGIGAVTSGVGLLSGGLLLALPRIAATQAALKTLGTTMPGVAAGARAATIAMKGLGALAAVAVTMEVLQAAFHKSGAELDRFAAETSASGTTSTEKLALLRAESAKLRTEMNSSGHLDVMGARLYGFGKQAGKAVDAADKYDKLQGSIKDLESQEKQEKAAAEAQAKARAEASSADAKAAEWQRVLAAQTSATADATDDERTAAEKLSDAINDLTGNAISAARAESEYRDSVDAITKAFKGKSKSTSLDTATGREHLGVVLDGIEAASKSAQAIADETGSVAKGRDAYAKRIADLKATLLHLGLMPKQVDALIREYGKVPPSLKTTVSTPGAVASKAQVDELKRLIAQLPADKRTQFRLDKGTTAADLERLREQIANLPSLKTINVAMRLTGNTSPSAVAAAIGKNAKASGGMVTGPGGPTEDAIPALLSNGEYVVNAAQTRKHRALLEAINAGRYAAGGLVRRLAKGGPARPTLDGISAQIAVQSGIATDASATASAVAKAAAEVVRLQALWQATADAIEVATRRTELQGDVAKALREQAAAAKTKDKGDDASARTSVKDARKALHDYNADQKQASQSRRNDSAAERAATAAAARKQREDDAKTARDKIAANRSAYLFDNMTQAEQLKDLETRSAKEVEYSDEWVALQQQHAQIAKDVAQQQQEAADAAGKAARDAADQANDEAKTAASTLNDLLDQRATILASLAAAQQTYASAVADANARLDEQTASAKAARVESLSAADLTKHAVLTGGVSMAALLRNASSNVEQLQQFRAELAKARAAGVSEEAISTLGLDNPQALGQLRQVNQGTAEQVAQLNDLVAARRAAAEQQATQEASAGVGAVGAAIRAATGERDAALADAATTLANTTADLTGQLSKVGVDQGRTWAQAIAEGVDSGLPGIQAAAARLTSTAANAATLASKVPTGYAVGGLVTGPGGPTDDAVLARLSAGEYVVNARATSQHRTLLDAINVGRFATGGFVSAAGIPVVARGSDGVALGEGLLSVELQQRRTVGVLEAIYDRLGMPTTEVRNVVISP